MNSVSRVFCIVAFFSMVFVLSSAFADGFLTVRTDPEGIEVWLDDNFVGDSPIIDKKLKSGRYSLKLVDPVQHSSTVEEIYIQDNENTVIEKTIKSKFGTLKVTSVPEGAEVSIATELGPTPVSNDFMNPGKYRLEIRHPDDNFHPVIEEIVIPRGESVSLSKTLEKEKPFDNKDFWRLALGVGTAGGYVLGIVQYARYTRFKELSRNYAYDEIERDDFTKKQNGPLVQSILGIVGGSLCLIGLEILAFF
ncbi:MAG: PEGA domain-containing protein [Chitinispirillaceae bacterium]|nr:PEGA domain-containing protein [Chitinispirillaceae bacterium]